MNSSDESKSKGAPSTPDRYHTRRLHEALINIKRARRQLSPESCYEIRNIERNGRKSLRCQSFQGLAYIYSVYKIRTDIVALICQKLSFPYGCRWPDYNSDGNPPAALS
jgi:hypothetical protein